MDLLDLVSIFSGWIVAVVLGHIMIREVVDGLWRATGSDKDPEIRPFAYLARLVGIIERTLYFGSIVIGRPEFIAIWLVLKVAARWGRWQEPYKNGSAPEHGATELPGRVFYNIFLIGNGLSIAFAFGGAMVTKSIETNFLRALLVVLVLVFGTYLFDWFAAKWQQNDPGI